MQGGSSCKQCCCCCCVRAARFGVGQHPNESAVYLYRTLAPHKHPTYRAPAHSLPLLLRAGVACCRCVCIVYDPQKSARGQISVRAIRLKDSFISLFKEGKLTGVCSRSRSSTHNQSYSLHGIQYMLYLTCQHMSTVHSQDNTRCHYMPKACPVCLQRGSKLACLPASHHSFVSLSPAASVANKPAHCYHCYSLLCVTCHSFWPQARSCVRLQ